LRYSLLFLVCYTLVVGCVRVDDAMIDDPSVVCFSCRLVLILVSDDVMIDRDRMFDLQDGLLGPMLLLTMSFFVHRGCVVYSHSGLYC